MSEKVRVLRILEYVGDRKWVEDTLKKGSVTADGIKVVDKNNMIKSCLIDKFPEILDSDNQNIKILGVDIATHAKEDKDV